MKFREPIDLDDLTPEELESLADEQECRDVDRGQDV